MTAFLANENIPKATVEKLREAGFDVVWISSDFPSIKDEAVLLFASIENRIFASIENRIILTFDRDYGELIFKQGKIRPRGVIYFRIGEFQPEEPAEILLSYLRASAQLFEGRFSVLNRIGIRQKPL